MRGLRRWLWGLLGGLAVASGVYLVSHQSIEVVVVQVESPQTPDLQKVFYGRLDRLTQSLKGRRFFLESPRGVANHLLEQEPWLSSVRVRRVFPNTMVIHAKPRELLYLAYKEDLLSFVAVASGGKIVEGVDLNQLPPLPVTVSPHFFENEKLRKEVAQLLENTQPSSELFRERVADLIYDPRVGLILSLRVSGQKIILGDEDFLLRAERASDVVKYLIKNQLRGRVIDSRFSQKVLVRPQGHL